MRGGRLLLLCVGDDSVAAAAVSLGRGSYVALDDAHGRGHDAVVYGALRGLLEWHVASGTDGVVALGTTGEASTLDAAERDRVLETCVDACRGRVPVVAGTGAIDTRAVVAMGRRAKALGGGRHARRDAVLRQAAAARARGALPRGRRGRRPAHGPLQRAGAHGRRPAARDRRAIGSAPERQGDQGGHGRQRTRRGAAGRARRRPPALLGRGRHGPRVRRARRRRRHLGHGERRAGRHGAHAAGAGGRRRAGHRRLAAAAPREAVLPGEPHPGEVRAHARGREEIKCTARSS